MFPKTKRRVDRDVIALVKSYPCCVCGTNTDVDADHLSHQGSGGHDDETNLIPLCRSDHIRRHAKGICWLLETYPLVKKYILTLGREDIIRRCQRKRAK